MFIRVAKKPAKENASPSAAKRHGQTTVSPVQLLQRRIGNEALMRLLAQPQNEPRLGYMARPPGILQAKLKIGTDNDPLEHEADRVAEQVMWMPAPEVTHTSAPLQINHKCAACEAEEEEKLQKKEAGYEHEANRTADDIMRMEAGAGLIPRSSGAASDARRACSCGGRCNTCRSEQRLGHEPLQMKPVGAGGWAGTAAPPIADEVLRSPGEPLDPATRAFFEPRFRYDFSRVRIHSDERAAASARSLGAAAYTVGQNVVFGAARFAPRTTAGRRLLAHELTHVVQQSRFTPGAPAVQRAPEVQVDPGATCNLDQHGKIEPAAYQAGDWLRTTIAAIDAFLGGAKTKQATAAGAALNRHFHSADAAVVAYVKARLETILKEIFSRENLRINCPPASDPICKQGELGGQEWAAVVPEGNPNEIDFCRLFFKRDKEDRASTIIHEFGHAQLGLRKNQEIIDRAYKSDAYYAYLTTAEALTNAESYAMLARQIATGSSPAPGRISDKVEKGCPADWMPLIEDAMTKARMWNHLARQHVAHAHEFWPAYRALEATLTSKIDFECEPDGGGRCPTSEFYWYFAGDLHICPSWRQLPSPDERAISMLAALYGYKRLLGADTKRDRAAREARRVHAANVPSTADVLKP